MNILDNINMAIQKEIDSKEHRNYLGASSLGEKCDRRLWYSYKMPKSDHDPRIQRIFDLGNMMEEYLISLLQKAGYTLYTKDEHGKQYGFEDLPIMGNSDGVIVIGDTPHLLEFKSYNEKRFNTLVKEGVRISDEKYYTQVCVYMEKMNLQKCIFMAINKNNCDIHVEIVNEDPIEANWALARGHQIANMDNEPDRKYDHKSHFACKMCNYRNECWREK